MQIGYHLGIHQIRSWHPTKCQPKVTVRWYSVKHKAYFRLFSEEPVNHGLNIPALTSTWGGQWNMVADAAWQSKFSVNTDLSLFSTTPAIIPETWPMPILEAEFSEFTKASNLPIKATVVDWTTGKICWTHQPSLMQSLALQGKFIPAWELHDLKNAAANLQSKGQHRFIRMKEALLTLLDYFVVHGEMYSKSPQIFEPCFALYHKHKMMLLGRKRLVYITEI